MPSRPRPGNDMAAIFADPHVAARRMLVDVEQPDGSRSVTLAGQPIKMTKSYTGIRHPPSGGARIARPARRNRSAI